MTNHFVLLIRLFYANNNLTYLIDNEHYNYNDIQTYGDSFVWNDYNTRPTEIHYDISLKSPVVAYFKNSSDVVLVSFGELPPETGVVISLTLAFISTLVVACVVFFCTKKEFYR